MPLFDPKWIDGIKSAISAGAAYKFSLAVVSGIYWYLLARHYVPYSAGLIQASSFGFLFFTLLWLANAIAVIADIFRPRTWFVHCITLRRQTREVENYLPHLSEKDREIIAYLLAHNQKTIIADMDGGHAMTLIARAFLIVQTAPGQTDYENRVPMIIPDNVWGVLQRHKDKFPYAPPPSGEVEPYPWRKHFMET
jgi:hypothetical protein